MFHKNFRKLGEDIYVCNYFLSGKEIEFYNEVINAIDPKLGWQKNIDHKWFNNKISFEIFAEIFGSGFPSVDGLKKTWENQKVKREGMSSDNLLDYHRAGLSLFKNFVNESI